MPDVNPPEFSVAKGAAVTFGLALAMTLLMAAPVIVAPSERIFGSSQFAPKDPNRDPLIVMEQFRTGQVQGPYLQPLTDIPGRALTQITGAVVAYNILVLATFPLSAAAAYLLARYVLGSHLGSMVGGLAYAFLPFHVAHSSNHPHVAQMQWLPLYFLAMWRCLDQPSLRRALLLLASAAAVTLSNFYAGLIAAVVSPVALIAYGAVSPHRPGGRRWQRLALTGLILAAAPTFGILLMQSVTPEILLRPEAFAFPRSDLFLHSAKWWSYLVPPVDHPLFASLVREFWSGSGVEEALLEQQVGVGWSLLALAIVPVWRWFRGDRSSEAIRSVPVFVSVALVALFCSLSPERSIGPFVFIRPSAFLYEVAPMFRAYARFGVVVGLMTSLLAGAGAAFLWRSRSRALRRAATMIIGLAVLEFMPFPPWRFRDVLPTRAHRWIAGQPGSLRVLDCVAPTRVTDALARSFLGHQVALLGQAEFDDCGEPRLGEKLFAKGYTYLIARRDSPIGVWLMKDPEAQSLTESQESEDAWILESTSGRPVAYVSALVDFYPREYDERTTWRWMKQTGSLRIQATRPSLATVVELELRAFPSNRQVEWLLNGQRRGQLSVTTEWRRYKLPIGPLAGLEATLTLVCRQPAMVPDDVIGNHDARALGLAIGSWGFEEDHDLR